MSRLPFPPAHNGNKVGRPGKGQLPCRGGSVAIESPHCRLVQRNKTFEPRLLVVPAGSIVDSPNNDPCLHNVFSISKGRQFDLGLYEAGVVRSVGFDRPGVSYLFCSIHPEMTAVVVTVDSTYFEYLTAAAALASATYHPGGTFFTRGVRMPQQKHSQQDTSPSAWETNRRSLPAITIALPKSKPTTGKKWMQ
jgi:plastocyanin